MRLFIVFALAAVLMGCQSLNVSVPAPKIEPPSTPGKGKFILGGDIGLGGVFTATDNAGERPPDLTRPSAEGGSLLLGPSFEYGILDRLAVGTKVGFGTYISEVSVEAKIKFLLLGSSWSQKSSGLQMAVWGRAGRGSSTESGDQSVTFGGGGYPWDGSVTDFYLGYGVSIGQRVSDRVLLYLGAAVDEHSLDADITQDVSDDLSDPGGSYTREYTGTAQSAGLGARFEWRVFAMDFYAAYTDGRFENETLNKHGITGGFRFEWMLNAGGS